MKKFIQFIKKWEFTIKLIFFISVLVLVINEIIRLSKTISISELSHIFAQLSPLAIATMGLLGLFALLPMLAYDIILNKEIKSQFPLKYILETSWTINSFNNLIGFAGLVDIGLRYSFYSNEENTEQSMQGISRVIPYFMTGFSLFALFALGIVTFLPTDESIVQYWPLLLAIASYLPFILIISSQKKLPYFGQLGKSSIVTLLASSFLEWLGVWIVFVSIGSLMGIHLPILSVFPILVIAHSVGILSMIPGGIGSFDLMMMTGLTGLGLQSTQVIAWILLFRLFYYILPFFIGIFFFIKHMGGRLNEKYLGLPDKLTQLLIENGEILFLRLFGFFMILSALIPDKVGHLPLIGKLDPIQAQLIWQFPSILLGGLFFILARFVRSRLSFSISFSHFLFFITIIYINLNDLSIPTSFFLILAYLMIFSIRKGLNRKVFIYTWESLSKDVLLFATTLLVFLISGGYHILAISHQSHKVSFTHYVISWSHIFILAIISLLVYYVVISLASRHKPEIGSVLDSERFTQLVDRYPTDSEASLAYLGDKLLYWYQVQEEDRIVFQFSIKNNKCIVMSDPIGDLTYVREAIADFIRHAKRQNMTLIFYEVSHETTILLHDFGYEFMKFGESARLDLRTFSLEGKQHKKYRSAINKIEAKGYYFQVLKAPHSQELLEDLRAVSTSWLNGRKEKGFSLGFFKVDYLQLAPLAVVKDSSGQIVAFVNFLPTNNNKVASIDLMRYHLELAPNGIMDYLFVNLFLYFKEAGVDYFDLGMAPLSNVGNMEDSFLQEKLAYLIYSLSSRFYSFAGLRQYKQKFNPIWQSKYIAYPRQNWLIYDMIAIFLIDNQAKSS